MRPLARWALLALLWAPTGALAADPHAAHRQQAPDAPGYGPLGYPLPAPGSYPLPPLGPASDGQVVDETGQATSLHRLFDDKLTVLSFIYTRCPDPNACPLASFALSRLQWKLAQQPALARRVQLVTLSFDPANDTPAVMAEYARRHRRDAGPKWAFVTTESPAALAPILEDYNQWVMAEYDAQGRQTGQLAHLLRVYLVDGQHRVRNIYSTGFLHSDLLLVDLETLALEGPKSVP
ncbi:SCO family protein [Ferrimonas balearica]|uniref:SCO family protein n=1 Tax=Ferrimonas balearica TaxID=44012 RepID=UPI001C99A68D|nr:SCO family protein [Ferrimonas balearica]MBY5993914.1 SCO family protein [Ferrimonas balearica]